MSYRPYRPRFIPTIEDILENVDPTGFLPHVRLEFKWCELRQKEADIEWQMHAAQRRKILAEKQLITRLTKAMDMSYKLYDGSVVRKIAGRYEAYEQDDDKVVPTADEILEFVKNKRRREAN